MINPLAQTVLVEVLEANKYLVADIEVRDSFVSYYLSNLGEEALSRVLDCLIKSLP